jgi:hypothetical protein
MRPGLPFAVAPVEQVQALEGDGTVLLGAEPQGDFPPGPALLALVADEIDK